MALLFVQRESYELPISIGCCWPQKDLGKRFRQEPKKEDTNVFAKQNGHLELGTLHLYSSSMTRLAQSKARWHNLSNPMYGLNWRRVQP